MDKHEKNSQMLSSYLDGELTEQETANVERALQNDAALSADLDKLRKVRRLVADLPRPCPPDGMAESIMLEAKRQNGNSANPKTSAKLGRYAAAAILLIGIGIASVIVYDSYSTKMQTDSTPQPHGQIARDDVEELTDDAEGGDFLHKTHKASKGGLEKKAASRSKGGRIAKPSAIPAKKKSNGKLEKNAPIGKIAYKIKSGISDVSSGDIVLVIDTDKFDDARAAVEKLLIYNNVPVKRSVEMKEKAQPKPRAAKSRSRAASAGIRNISKTHDEYYVTGPEELIAKLQKGVAEIRTKMHPPCPETASELDMKPMEVAANAIDARSGTNLISPIDTIKADTEKADADDEKAELEMTSQDKEISTALKDARQVKNQSAEGMSGSQAPHPRKEIQMPAAANAPAMPAPVIQTQPTSASQPSETTSQVQVAQQAEQQFQTSASSNVRTIRIIVRYRIPTDTRATAIMKISEEPQAEKQSTEIQTKRTK